MISISTRTEKSKEFLAGVHCRKIKSVDAAIPAQSSVGGNDRQPSTHPSPSGQLASDLGVPRAAVSVAALFTKSDVMSIGTLSSRGSQDGWSDPGWGGHSEDHQASFGKDGAVGLEAPQVSEAGFGATAGTPLFTTTMQEQDPQRQGFVAEPTEPWGTSVSGVAVEGGGPMGDQNVPPPSPPPQQHQGSGGVLVGEEEQMNKVQFGDDDDDLGWGGGLEATQPESVDAVRAVHHEENFVAPADQLERTNVNANAVPFTETATILTPENGVSSDGRIELAVLRGQAQAAEAERAAAQSEIEQMKVAEEDLRRRQEEMEATNAALAAQISDLQRIRCDFDEERKDLQARCQAAEAVAAEKIAAMTKELEAQMVQIEAERAEREALVIALAEQEAIHSRAVENEEERVKHALEMAKKDVEEEFKCTIERMNVELDDRRSALELKDDAIAALKEHGSQIEAEIQRLRADELEYKTRYSQAAVEAAVVEALRDHDDVQTANAVAALRTEMEQKLAASDSELQHLQAVVDEKDAEIMQLEAQVMTAAGKAASELEEALAKERAQLEASHSRSKELEKKFALAKKKIQAQQVQHEQVTTEVEALRRQLAETEARAAGEAAGRDAEMEELSGALSRAQHAQQELLDQAEALQARLVEAERIRTAELESVAADTSSLVELLAEKEDHEERMVAEIAQLRSQVETYEATQRAQASSSSAADEKEAKALAAALENEIAQWTAVAEDADARCTAAEEALEAEREAAAVGAAHMKEEVAALHAALQATETQLRELEAVQEEELEGMAQRVRAAEQEVIAARAASNSRSSVRAIEDYEEALEEVRAQLVAASEAAAQKEEEMRKYKLQLVKAKKIRAADQEKIAALEEEKKKVGGAPGLQEEMVALRQQLEAVREELSAVRCVANDAEEGLEESLSALGQEEAKVARLAQLLVESGLMSEECVDAELSAVEELVGFGEEGGGGGEGGQEEESLV